MAYPAQGASWSSASSGKVTATHVTVYDATEPIDEDDSWMDEEEDW